MISQRWFALCAPSVLACVLAACAPLQPTPSSTLPPLPAPAPPPVPEPPAVAVPAPSPVPVTEQGRVSLYGGEFAGRKTASGEIFDPQALTMAHRTLPFGTRVLVVNLANQRSVAVIVNDRGPAVPDRIADLSLAAARRLGMIGSGVIEALLKVVGASKSGMPR